MTKLLLPLLVLATGCATAPPPIARVDQPVVADDRPESAGPTVRASSVCPAPRTRLCFVLEIVDIHTDATSPAKGFDELRARAAALNADAVIGAEFEHGESGTSHLAGMIVRYGDPLPPFVEIAVIEIASDPNSADKGLSALVARGRELGADRVVEVTFEHGEDGAPGHLRGRAVRYTR